ncbi:hypothetical protein DITRI_Ditri19aG0072700 [Diplodiscus trichospermus]
MAKARTLDDPKPTTRTTISLVARLKVDEESSNCWDSLIQLQSCTGEIIVFFMNGEADLGDSCCKAIRTICRQCWPTMIVSLGFTTEETHVLEGYCDHEDDQSSPNEAKVRLKKMKKRRTGKCIRNISVEPLHWWELEGCGYNRSKI